MVQAVGWASLTFLLSGCPYAVYCRARSFAPTLPSPSLSRYEKSCRKGSTVCDAWASRWFPSGPDSAFGADDGRGGVEGGTSSARFSDVLAGKDASSLASSAALAISSTASSLTGMPPPTSDMGSASPPPCLISATCCCTRSSYCAAASSWLIARASPTVAVDSADSRWWREFGSIDLRHAACSSVSAHFFAPRRPAIGVCSALVGRFSLLRGLLVACHCQRWQRCSSSSDTQGARPTCTRCSCGSSVRAVRATANVTRRARAEYQAANSPGPGPTVRSSTVEIPERVNGLAARESGL